jgi:hypothetical protein
MSSEVSVSSATEDDDDVPVGLGERLRQIVAVPGRLLGVLLIPDKAMPEQVNAQRYGAALLAIIICGLLGQAAIASRLDVSTDILQQAAQGMGPGGPGSPGGGAPGAQGAQAAATKSDREIQEEITKTLSVERVTRVLNYGAWKPIKYSLLAVLLYILLRFVGGQPTMKKAYSTAIHASLPYAVKALVVAAAALAQASLTPSQADSLVANPLAPTFAQMGGLGVVLSAVDPFVLWSVALLAFGAGAAAQISRKRAFVSVLVGFALFLGMSTFFSHAGGGGGGPQGQQMEGNR